MQSITTKLLKTGVAKVGGSVVLTCTGSAETEAIAALSQVLSDLHDDVVRDPVPRVIVDLRGLEFASSSCLKVFVTWLQRVLEMDDAHRYQVVFRSDPTHSWQRRSLGALATFASGVVEIDPEVR